MADHKGRSQLSFPVLCPRKYDVFLSYRVDDTSKTFVDHLYSTLCQVWINTFRSEDEHVSSHEVPNAIEGSIIFIIVLSRNYASSIECLNELLHILELKKKSRRLVLPIFYDVDPSDVRKQTGIFAEAFARHKTPSQSEQSIQLWGAALNQVGNL
ncbi:PREDICTED: TMV resistance protein N-like [Nicotiana attenuata]|uniref:TMV resistance protein N-like n=1 Tax=Nicotiana attenuata TaxID=49451 RepID=UPI000905BFA3|nr:PREDICTED: TMV resistance protein N-like [Nicotiana attenuata]